MVDAVATMDWRRVVPWKVLSLAARPGKRPVPFAYGSNVFPKDVGEESRLWVVTRARARDPYSLLACLHVKEVCTRKDLPSEWWPRGTERMFRTWSRVAVARTAGSRFFGTNNADDELKRLGVRFYGPFCYLRRPPNDAFESCVSQARRTVFVSYKWAESKRYTLRLARALRDEGLSPWFDALSIPEYDEKREPGVTEQRLDELIHRGIANSRVAVVINSEEFAKAGWSLAEWRRIRAAPIHCFQVMRGGRALEGAEKIEDRTPLAAARRIADRCEALRLWGCA